MNGRMQATQPSNNNASVSDHLDDLARRILDIVASLVGLILLAPLFLLVAIAIKRSSPGPIFFWGPRAGRGGKPFQILKFRTMYERKESYSGPKVTAENDPRITPLGRILRQTKLNELPQLWNVLRGDMSLVGPRPEDPALADQWPEQVRREILSVRPGITSPASVVYRNEEDLLQSSNLMDTYLWDILPSKLRLDQIYVRNRSVLTDLDVIFWTLVALLPRLKSFSVPEHLLYWGPLSRFMYYYLGWFLVDFAVAFLAVGFAGFLRRLSTPFDLGFQASLLISLAIAALLSLINAITGINRINWTKARSRDALDLALSTTVVTVMVTVATLVFPTGARFPISVILAAGLLSYLGFVVVRYRSRLVTGLASYWLRLRGQSMAPLGERVLIVGAGEVSRFAVWLLTNENLARAFSVVGMVDDDPRKVGAKVDGYPVIATTNAIPEMVKKHDIGLILYAISDIDPQDHDRILSLCQTTPARIIPIPDIIDSLRAQFPRSETEREVHFNKVLHNATTDRLTGAYNRQHFLRLAEVEFNRSQRYGRPISIFALQVDYARPNKSAYSQSVATKVMQETSRRCRERIRGIDLFGRYSDDVLLVLLPETDAETAALVADRLKQFIADEPVETNRGPVQTIPGVSLVTNYQDEFEDVAAMVAALVLPEANEPTVDAADTQPNPRQIHDYS